MEKLSATKKVMKKVELGKLKSGDIFIKNKRAFQYSYKSDEGFIIALEMKYKHSYSLTSKDIVLTSEILSYEHFKIKRKQR